MPPADVPVLRSSHPALRRVVRAGVLVAVSDALFASAFGVFVRQVTVARVWEGVASVVVGKGAIDGGTTMVLVGLLMHVLVAFVWSTLLLVAVRRSFRLRAIMDSDYGPLKVATILGPIIWLVMSLGVIPLLVHRMPSVNGAYVAMLVGHIPFVGLPMALAIRNGSM